MSRHARSHSVWTFALLALVLIAFGVVWVVSHRGGGASDNDVPKLTAAKGTEVGDVTQKRDAADDEVDPPRPTVAEILARGDSRKARSGVGGPAVVTAPKTEGETASKAEIRAAQLFAKADQAREELDKFDLRLPEKQLKKDLTAMMMGYRKVATLYREVIKLDQARWVVAAYCRLGTLFENFGTEIRSSPVPPDIGVDKELRYAEGLDASAQGFVEQAIDAYRSCVEEARDRAVNSEHSAGCEARLRLLQATEGIPQRGDVRP